MSDVGNQPVCENCAGQKHTDMGTTLCHVCAGTGVYINPSSESLKDAIITAIRRHIRLEWHSHDHADINHRSLQAASEEVASLIEARSAGQCELNQPPAEYDITQPMIQAGRYAANLNDSTLARIYLAMRTVEWEEAQASARDQPPASSGKVQLVEMDEIWTFKETRKYLLSEIERLRDDLHAVGKNLTGEQPEAVSCLDTAYGRTANISSILSNAPTATQIPASSDPAALAEQEDGDA